jgi:hypothetical protein
MARERVSVSEPDQRSSIWNTAQREGWALVSLDDTVDRLSRSGETVYVTYLADDTVNVAEHLHSYVATRCHRQVLMWLSTVPRR